ncbi:TATA-box-binding protein-like 1 [Panonychus citri]|uniref:TATA-box-binding protein-like 1 n=1 Tax=Panonychus citri TaxID=50023 RepID=UPI002307D622|nr:TATA-box-binding protein-like 1 [Panonychus citri]
MYRIVNMTICFEVNSRLEPNDFPNYDPYYFSGNILNCGKVKVLIYRSNKVNVVGAKSLDEATNVLINVLPNYSIVKSKIVNIVASGTIDFPINLNKIIQYPEFTWEPELFPGIMFRVGKQVAIFFSSRKFNIVGSKSMSTLENFYYEFINTLRRRVNGD